MNTKHHTSSFRPACLALLIAATSLASAGEGGGLSDMVTDDLSFAVAVPEGFRLENGDAVLALQYQAGPTTLSETIDLTIAPSDAFASAVDATGMVYVGSFDSAAKQQFEQFRQAVEQSEATGIEGDGGLTISVTGGCFSGELPEALPISTWVRMDADDGYVRLVRNRDLYAMLDRPTRQRLMANLRTCQ